MTSNKNNSKAMSMVINCIWIILLIVLDQITKLFAIAHLKNIDSKSLIRGVFELRYLENRGAAFGMMQNIKVIFVIIALLMLMFVIFALLKLPDNKRYLPLRIIMILIGAGAVGNLIDRLFRGFVVDFFYFSLIDFPIFNVADIYVSVSCILLVILVLFVYKDGDFEFLNTGKDKE